MQDNYNMLLNNQLNKDDCYNFKCNKCGKCCTNHTGIILTPFDIYNMAKKLEMSIENAISLYCVRYIGKTSQLPIVAFEAGRCPLVTEHGCYLGDSRPVICKMYPLGCGYQGNKTTYFYVDAKCGENNSTQTVGEWLTKNGLGEDVDEFRKMWYGVLDKLCKYIHDRNFSERELDSFQTSVFVILYLCYDTTKSFVGQFSTRIDCIERIIQDV